MFKNVPMLIITDLSPNVSFQLGWFHLPNLAIVHHIIVSVGGHQLDGINEIFAIPSETGCASPSRHSTIGFLLTEHFQRITINENVDNVRLGIRCHIASIRFISPWKFNVNYFEKCILNLPKNVIQKFFLNP